MRVPGPSVTVAATVIAISLVACDPGDSVRPPGPPSEKGDSSTVGSSAPATSVVASQSPGPPQTAGLLPPWRLTGKVTAATVFIDLSASMQGFGREKSGPFAAMMSRLKGFLLKEGVSDISGAGFGAKAETPKSLGGPVELLSLPAREANTCLAGPIESTAGSDLSMTKALIIITDGVASATAGACGRACSAGNDVACVAKALADVAQRGQAIWLVGLRMPFEGSYYPELGAHPFAAPQGTLRPIYLWILSPDLEMGRHLTSALRTWGQTYRGEGNVIAAEVWPGNWLGYRVAEQPKMGWSSSDFTADGYAQATGVVSKANVASIHFESCSDATRRHPLATPFLCLQQSPDQLIWVGQVPIVPADGSEGRDPAVASLVTAVSPLSHPTDVAAAPGGKQASPAVAAGCLTVAGNPVREDQMNVVNARWIAGCVEPPPSTSVHRDRYRLLAAVEFRNQANIATIGVKWQIKSDLGALSTWNTEDDRTPATVSQTLGLLRLWELVGDLLARQPQATELIELGRSPRSGG